MNTTSADDRARLASERSLPDLIKYLEKRGLIPEYGRNKTRFRHPQRLSRIATLARTKMDLCAITFSHPLEEFSEHWCLSPEGELPVGLNTEEIKLTLDDFFQIVEVHPPAGSPPFEQRLQEVKEIIHRYAGRHQRMNNYELSYEDLVQIATIKTYEVYRQFGDKPFYEFQCLVARSIERRFVSLLSKHYVSKCRAGAEVIALTDEMREIISEDPGERISATDWDDYLRKLTRAERVLVEAILRPNPVLRRDNHLETLRYRRVKFQSPKCRIAVPKYHLKKIALASSIPLSELICAYSHLIESIPTKAWNDLIEAEPTDQ